MEFLPDDYIEPVTPSGGYFKIQDGENRIRILTSPMLGHIDGIGKNTVRYRMGLQPTKSSMPDGKIRHFWTFIIWDYTDKAIKIFECAQATIWKRIGALSKDLDWGAPYFYDIKIKKKGKEKETQYEVTPVPGNRDLSEDIKTAFYEKPMCLEELFSNGDPFNSSKPRTLGFWEKESKKEDVIPLIEDPLVSIAEAYAIDDRVKREIDPVDPNWKKSAFAAFKIDSFSKLKKKHFDLMMKRIDEKKKSMVEDEIPF